MVIRRLKRWLLLRDPELRYIVEVGVDEIPEIEDPVTPRAAILGAAGGDIERTSRFLDTEEALRYFLQGMEQKLEYSVRLLGAAGGADTPASRGAQEARGPLAADSRQR